MASCRHSAPHIILIPKELCHPAAPAVWCLPLRTAWSPRPWVKLVLMFSTEPSQHTQASQVGVCGIANEMRLQRLFLCLAGAVWNPLELPLRCFPSLPCSCPGLQHFLPVSLPVCLLILPLGIASPGDELGHVLAPLW